MLEVFRDLGAAGDERLILMAALLVADELFDARADIDDLLEGRTEDSKSFAGTSATISSDRKREAG